MLQRLGAALLFAAVALAQQPGTGDGKDKDKPKEKDADPVVAGKPLSVWAGRLKDLETARRFEAAEAISELDEAAAPAAAALVAALREKDPYVLQLVTGTLVRIGKPALPALLPALKDDEPSARRAAGIVVGSILDGEASDEVVAGLLALLKDKDVMARGVAARALGRTKSEKAAAPLLEALKKDDPLVRRFAATSLGELKAEAAIEPLLALVKDGEPMLRRAAIDALRDFPAKLGPAIPALLDAAKDKDATTREMALVTLGRTSPLEGRVLAALAKGFDDPNERVRGAAEKALGKIDEKSLPALRELLKEKDEKQRSIAVALLGSLREAALPDLKTAVKDPSVEVRRAALQALLDIRTPAIVPVLAEAMADEDLALRRQVGRILAQVGRAAPKEVVPALAKALKDKDEEVRMHAVTGLARLGPEAVAALPALREFAKDEKGDLKKVAEEAIAMIGTAEPRVPEPIKEPPTPRPE